MKREQVVHTCARYSFAIKEGTGSAAFIANGKRNAKITA